MTRRCVVGIQIPMGGKRGQGLSAFVDDDDAPLVSEYRWNVDANGYAQARVGEKTVRMHRLIMGFPESGVDHVNGDKLDNRKSNLRLANQSQNNMNASLRMGSKSGFKGVYKHSDGGYWVAQITVESKTEYIGRFRSPVDAAIAYNRRALEVFGEFARLNPIPTIGDQS